MKAGIWPRRARTATRPQSRPGRGPPTPGANRAPDRLRPPRAWSLINRSSRREAFGSVAYRNRVRGRPLPVGVRTVLAAEMRRLRVTERLFANQVLVHLDAEARPFGEDVRRAITLRRITTAPDVSSPTTLPTFLPRSTPRTAISIPTPPSELPAILRRRKEGRASPIKLSVCAEGSSRRRPRDDAGRDMV